ncbi:UvrD-helicase domain-containing protein [Streptomyces deccanensis]|uniref:UvrD-helicase domain-containing protein n=1 Tax=Streptomyces deccanensis TaxID=424188 RepID=UPI001EFA761C|nr:UvrD-helicase domain-containing protein [Streptomyces deccanensis]ULR54649.1 UvrD-helicase domain-containing protein [Streptomyces deccanensis]
MTDLTDLVTDLTDLDVPSLREITVLRAEAEAAQRALVDLNTEPGRVMNAQACPGAGKTRSVVERHLDRPVPPGRGRAVLSFTKVAGSEVRKRCVRAGRPELTQFPHYIGTFDTFVWRHLVRPYLRPTEKKTWHRLESWDDHPQARREGVTLDDFVFHYAEHEAVRLVRPALRPGGLPHRLRNDEKAAARLTSWAGRAMRELWQAGYLSGDQLRDMAHSLLTRGSRRERIARVLNTRFAEIVIDEAQDCSDDDLILVDLIRAAGVPLLLVGDPDQSIYGFRDHHRRAGGDRTRLGFTTEPDHRLSHNWRSTQVICDLAHTLRTSDAPRDVATGPHHAETAPVLLIPTTDRTDTEWIGDFNREATRLGIPPQERLVVAHRRSLLPKAMTGTRTVPTAKLDRLIWATAVLRSPAAATRQRELAGRTLREAVLDHWHGVAPDEPEPVGLSRHHLTGGELRIVQQTLLRKFPPLSIPPRDWSRAACQALREEAVRLGMEPKTTGAYRCTRPRAEAWELVGFGDPQSARTAVGRAGTVHAVKGQEADAVLIIVPPVGKAKEDDRRSDLLIKAWTTGAAAQSTPETAEALRVLYVAVTRARRLVALALSDTHVLAVKAFLTERATPHRALHDNIGEQTMFPW